LKVKDGSVPLKKNNALGEIFESINLKMEVNELLQCQSESIIQEEMARKKELFQYGTKSMQELEVTRMRSEIFRATQRNNMLL
jgi:hypothetical protein